jgi:hypothetical protein
MLAESTEYLTSNPPTDAADRLWREHHLRMINEGWPLPQTETPCYACHRSHWIVAYESLGPLAKPPGGTPMQAAPPRPTRAQLEKRLAELEAENTLLRKRH